MDQISSSLIPMCGRISNSVDGLQDIRARISGICLLYISGIQLDIRFSIWFGLISSIKIYIGPYIRYPARYATGFLLSCLIYCFIFGIQPDIRSDIRYSVVFKIQHPALPSIKTVYPVAGYPARRPDTEIDIRPMHMLKIPLESMHEYI